MQPNTRRKERPSRKPLSPRSTILLCVTILIIIAVVGIVLDQYHANSSLWNPVSKREINAALLTNPQTLSLRRQTVVDSAVSLVGKVHYFWGGKSAAIGWDERWGLLSEVTSEGSPTTGTKRPMGLDCSGFVTWCFIQTGYSWEEAVARVGNGTMNQFTRSEEIAWSELQPGDLVFQHEPNDPEGNHVGICIGFDRNGEPLFAHCAAGKNNVIVTHADDVFRCARRPAVYAEPDPISVPTA